MKNEYKDEEYEICKEACAKDGCYLPPSNEFHSVAVNTPLFIRAYFYLKGLNAGRKEVIEEIRKTIDEANWDDKNKCEIFGKETINKIKKKFKKKLRELK